MRKLFLVLMMSVCGLIAQAATKYEINVGGVEVTSDNCSNIAPASNNGITGGYAVYDPSTNTLTLNHINIRRSGNGKYAIHNRKCDNLKIILKGSSYVGAADNAMKLERSTTIVSDDGDITIMSGPDAVAVNLGSYNYYFNGHIYVDYGKTGIKGNGSGSTTVYFQNGAKVNVGGIKNHAMESFKAVYNEGSEVTIEANGSSTSVSSVSMYFYGRETVLSPAGAYYSSSAIYTEGGSQVTSDDIFISDNYVAKLTSDYFPDANFCGYLRRSCFPKGYINSDDVNATKIMNVSSEYISSLRGLEYFTKLENFSCDENNLTWLPSMPSTLKILRCRENKLTSLPSMPSGLTLLVCDKNQLTVLPTFTSSLQTLECENNKLTGSVNLCNLSGLKTLDISNNPSMTTLLCYNDALTSLNITGCTGLTTLHCYNNQLTTLPETLPAKLQTIYCNNNKFNDYITWWEHDKLKTVNISNNPNLKGFAVMSCPEFTTLDVRNCSSMTELTCSDNQITSLDLSGCSSLTQLDCSENKLTSISNIPKSLQGLDCLGNLLTSLNVQGCSALKQLDCSFNKLTSLNVQGCTALRKIICEVNQIKGSGANTLVNSLCTIPAGSQGELLYSDSEGIPYSDGTIEGNVITNAQVAAARAKRWIPKTYNGGWIEIPVGGDVNGDGKINVSDVTALVNMILGVIPKNEAVADINGDGKVNVSDVTALVNMILGAN